MDTSYRFLVDPIDGTTNFLNGLDYTITIAIAAGSETVCGLVYNPVTNEMFTAQKGQGAYLNGRKLVMRDSVDVGQMVVGTGLPTPNLSMHPGAYERLDAIRARSGLSACWQCCQLLRLCRLRQVHWLLRADRFVDTAAGILLVEEAVAS